jgi:hypothetical protein
MPYWAINRSRFCRRNSAIASSRLRVSKEAGAGIETLLSDFISGVAAGSALKAR